jgi:NAD(P)-dependent dehydrogenase (short-subunit alcohol dehydrogenase family)
MCAQGRKQKQILPRRYLDLIQGSERLLRRMNSRAKFMKCDVRNWDEQVAVFEAASAASPCKSVDIVIANAGIIGADDFNTQQGNNDLL